VDPRDYRSAFGLLSSPAGAPSLDDARAFLRAMGAMRIDWVCVTAGSPYYNPHIQRPALFPPSDGYLPPEDPLVGVARQIAAVATLKREFPELAIVGSGYSYLQEWLPHVGQAAVRQGLTDFVGLGRMVLSYPGLPLDVLAGRPLRRAQICRTFSDCTSGPRNGLVSGCFPLDPFYKTHPDAAKLKAFKEAQS
jgi:2,4-dienoyl-CoA reductase-like NADH-dependent reductase (Old Yellow Enzyme family)